MKVTARQGGQDGKGPLPRPSGTGPAPTPGPRAPMLPGRMWWWFAALVLLIIGFAVLVNEVLKWAERKLRPAAQVAG